MSSFTWLDYSEHDKQKMLDLIEQFNERNTRDELGIGGIRDGFADMFFPGTSTIQTRARYFLFVPWIYLILEERRIPSADVAPTARKAEIELSKVLSTLPENEGAIGSRAGVGLKRLPSNVYWSGLRAWGILQFPGSQDQYHRWLDTYYSQRHAPRNDDGEPPAGQIPSNWHSGIPKPPVGFPKEAQFHLTAEEALFLRERVSVCAGGTLLSFLVANVLADQSSGFPWQHQARSTFPSPIQQQLANARNFSECMHGAALLYNLMLAEKSDHAEWVELYSRLLAQWADDLTVRRDEIVGWDRSRFWRLLADAGHPSGINTHVFVESWLDIALDVAAHSAVAQELPHARALVARRERALKGNLARLANDRALELWGGAAGAGQLDYRWRSARTIINDIVESLMGGGAC